MTDPTNTNPTQGTPQTQQPQNLSNGLGHIYAGAITTALAVAYYHSNIQPLDFQPLAPIQPILHAAASAFDRGSLEALICGSAEVLGIGMLVRGFSDRAEYQKANPVQPQYQQQCQPAQQPSPAANPAQAQPQVNSAVNPQAVDNRQAYWICLHSGERATTICPNKRVAYYEPCRIPAKCTMHKRVRP